MSDLKQLFLDTMEMSRGDFFFIRFTRVDGTDSGIRCVRTGVYKFWSPSPKTDGSPRKKWGTMVEKYDSPMSSSGFYQLWDVDKGHPISVHPDNIVGILPHDEIRGHGTLDLDSVQNWSDWMEYMEKTSRLEPGETGGIMEI